MRFAALATLAVAASALRLQSGRDLTEKAQNEELAWKGYLSATEDQAKAENVYVEKRKVQMDEEIKLESLIKKMNAQEKVVSTAIENSKVAREALQQAVATTNERFNKYMQVMLADELSYQK